MKTEITAVIIFGAAFLIPFTSVAQVPGGTGASVAFKTSDSALQTVVDLADFLAKENIAQFGKYRVMVEGAAYKNVWLETQPMGGYMYGRRDAEIARKNIEIFMDHQRPDGRLPGMISVKDGKLLSDYGWFQGFCFAEPALETWYLLGKDKAFGEKLYTCLEKFDAYLWKTRDSDGDGCLETWCVWDTGEDGCVRFGKAPCSWPLETPPSLETAGNTVNCYIANKKVLSFIKGVRVVTDKQGQLLTVVGIETDAKQVKIEFDGKAYEAEIYPNVTFGFTGKFQEVKRVPFFQPF